ncbi:MAG TPA: isochorismatase family cysteine hydrolase [Bacilli bacterium]
MPDELSISAMPYPFHCRVNKTALVMIDMQNDFCTSGGFAELLGNDVSLTKAIIPAMRVVLDVCRQLGMLVIHTREGHLPDLSDCPPSTLKRSKAKGAGIGDVGPMGRILIRGELGHAIVPELTPLEEEWIIDKPGKGAFYNTQLDSRLKSRQIESLILTGVTTHVCVHTTLREANDRGYECLVLEDATAAFDLETQEAAIRMIHQQGGIFGWVSNTASLINSL